MLSSSTIFIQTVREKREGRRGFAGEEAIATVLVGRLHSQHLGFIEGRRKREIEGGKKRGKKKREDLAYQRSPIIRSVIVGAILVGSSRRRAR